jgi:hypothetical protein
MEKLRRETPNDDAGTAYRELIADFLAVRAVRERHQGGYPAFEGELMADGAGMLVERKLLVFVRAVLCEWREGSRVKAAAPSLWFLISRGGNTPEAFVDSFAVETELVIEALQKISSSPEDLQIPLPAVEARDPDVDRVVAGDPLHLRISYTRIEPVPGRVEPRLPAAGIRFAVGGIEEKLKRPPPFSFAMVGLTPLLALDAAIVQYSGPSSFVLELEELGQEIERTPE